MRACFLAVFLIVPLMTASARADAISEAIQALQKVQPGGKETSTAREASRILATAGGSALVPILSGFSGTDRLGANWLRNAFEENVTLLKSTETPLPVKDLEAFVLDLKQAPIARRLAYETLLSSVADAEERLIPGMLLDPSPEFRRDAVTRLIEEAKKATDSTESGPVYRKALIGAVHEDQVKTIAEALRAQGATVDIQKHFGFIPEWKIAGPFDNKDEKGFAVPYGPEEEAAASGVNLTAEYEGQLGKVTWADLATEDDFGVVDIAKQIQNYKGSLMYLNATWSSDSDKLAEIRLGTPNAWKLWINGVKVFEREEYHRNSEMDQYKIPVTLKAGKNSIVLKLCQNEQTQEWAQDYQFQLRICDSTGAGLLPVTSTAANTKSEGVSR